jgi:putative ABC transport system ATP-binding protein
VSPVLSLRGVAKGYREGATQHVVLRDVDLEVSAGEVVALVGRSGSGKTTLLTVAAGLEEPDAGTVALLGRPVRPAPTWAELALLPQALGLLEELSIEENVGLPLRLGVLDGLDVGDLLARLGLAHLAGRHPSEVSLGEQQRAALARAAVARPVVLLADEPISHQNEAWGREALDVIAELAANGAAVLLATHHPAALDVAHRVVALRDGLLHPAETADRPAATWGSGSPVR